MNIGQRMRDRRIELNINPKDIAEKIGKSVSTYYRYETGEIEKLTINKMCEIAEYLKVSPVYLLLGEDSQTEYKSSNKKAPTMYNTSYPPRSVYKASQNVVAYANEDYTTQKLKEILLSSDKSTEELAELTGISIDDINKYKEGNSYVDYNHIISISDNLNIPIVDLILKRDDTNLLKKISQLNAIEIKEVEQFIDSMKKKEGIKRNSQY